MLIKRETSNGANDFITVYRPYLIDEMVGQEVNKKLIKNNLSEGTMPHSLLFTGPPGCGKTTSARVIALGLQCEEAKVSTDIPCLKCKSCKTILNQNNLDVVEVNVGKSGGKDAVDRLTSNLAYSPLSSKYKVIIMDECHKLTPAAQDLLLTEIENGYSHVYFIFCTNEPEKLRKPFRDRTRVVHFGTIPDNLLIKMLKNICDYEGVPYNIDILKYVVDLAKGTPRVAISYLKSVIDEASWDLESIKLLLINQSIDEDNPNIMEIGKLLMRGNFKEVLKVLKKLNNIPEETIRIATAGFFTSRLTWCKSFGEGDKLSAVLDVMTKPILMSGKPAYHVLVNNFYKASKIMKGR